MTRVALTLSALAAVTAFAFSQHLPPTPADVFVAPGGDDRGPGTETRPFASLARARDAVRVLRAETPNRDDRDVLRGGLYRIPETLVCMRIGR